MKLRPYQKQAVDAVVSHFKNDGAPACVVLPTGAGKSLVIAELCRIAKGRVLVLAHVKELCEQNYEKFLRMGGDEKAGLYSAGLGKKQSERKITFGSVQSVAGHLEDFSQPITLVIIDECHRVSLDDSSQYVSILRHAKKNNPGLFVLGLTATPYRLSMGFCYQKHAWGLVRSEEEKPFSKCVYEVTLRYMVEAGYLTPPSLIDAPIAQYDFSSLETERDEMFAARKDDSGGVNRLLVRHKRVTRAIVEQIVSLTVEQARRGVMIFAATVDHANEILSYLPQGEAGVVLGATHVELRDRTVQDFCAGKLRYLVNVSVLTTGFDAPHVDFIAILRRTESVSLFQQIVGRGLRLHDEKRDCLVVDYAGNGFDLYAPEIGESKPNSKSVMVKVPCPACEFENDFWGLLDAEGRVVEHYGRRCMAYDRREGARCSYRFRFKECPACNGENDIAARACTHCGKVLVDPDDLLKNALSLKDALVLRVSGMQYIAEGNRLTLVYHDEDGAKLEERFDFDNLKQRAVFNRTFSRRLASGRRPLTLETAQQAAQLQTHLPRPDFVVARAKRAHGKPIYFRIAERVFDYKGRFRKAVAAD